MTGALEFSGTEIGGRIVLGNPILPLKPCAFSSAANQRQEASDTLSLVNPEALEEIKKAR